MALKLWGPDCIIHGYSLRLVESRNDKSVYEAMLESTSRSGIELFLTADYAPQFQLFSAALIGLEVPFPHDPFVLPAGAPLHWAVATSSHCVISALVGAGANSQLRNGSDPYIYDERIRLLYAVGGPDAEGCTFVEPGCLGLSALDVVALHRDLFVLGILSAQNESLDANDADEEGFTVLHRLATNQIFRTSRGIRYSPRSFRDINDTDVLQSMVAAVTSLHSIDAGYAGSGSRPDRSTAETVEPASILKTGPKLLLYSTPRTEQILSSPDSYDKNSALLAAAKGRLLGVFDLLLSQGAHIDERDDTPRTATPGVSVFAFFASTRDDADCSMLGLFTRHVFGSSDEEEREQVLKGVSNSGSTPLHEFASCAMPQCVEAILSHGALVNALERKTRVVKQEEGVMRRV
ncbi:hypothetical protein EJ02DRAFT_492792 [Clathrospora elynae]|uniref:Ankyrin n=1 Tax=Clathrospora elynae TaxID=706981 RepID=A0A6A5SRP4_9PLEO|nr:hypothetical protein EJ02DRAFT_492792 [Clathrospora elynae]